MNHSQIVSFLWGIADIIRDTFKRGKYQDVILRLTIASNGLGARSSTCIDPKTKVVQDEGSPGQDYPPGQLPAQPRAGVPQVEGRGEGRGWRFLRA